MPFSTTAEGPAARVGARGGGPSTAPSGLRIHAHPSVKAVRSWLGPPAPSAPDEGSASLLEPSSPEHYKRGDECDRHVSNNAQSSCLLRRLDRVVVSRSQPCWGGSHQAERSSRLRLEICMTERCWRCRPRPSGERQGRRALGLAFRVVARRSFPRHLSECPLEAGSAISIPSRRGGASSSHRDVGLTQLLAVLIRRDGDV